jgi:hypothetical protein
MNGTADGDVDAALLLGAGYVSVSAPPGQNLATKAGTEVLDIHAGCNAEILQPPAERAIGSRAVLYIRGAAHRPGSKPLAMAYLSRSARGWRANVPSSTNSLCQFFNQSAVLGAPIGKRLSL